MTASMLGSKQPLYWGKHSPDTHTARSHATTGDSSHHNQTSPLLPSLREGKHSASQRPCQQHQAARCCTTGVTKCPWCYQRQLLLPVLKSFASEGEKQLQLRETQQEDLPGGNWAWDFAYEGSGKDCTSTCLLALCVTPGSTSLAWKGALLTLTTHVRTEQMNTARRMGRQLFPLSKARKKSLHSSLVLQQSGLQPHQENEGSLGQKGAESRLGNPVPTGCSLRNSVVSTE